MTADSLSLDTMTDTQSTALPEEVVQNLPNSGRDFTQMLAQTPGFAGLSTGGGAGRRGERDAVKLGELAD